MRFLPVKYTVPAMAFIMSLVMSGVISLAFVLLDEGITLGSISTWPLSWLKGWIIALPVAILIMPLVRKLVMKITIQ